MKWLLLLLVSGLFALAGDEPNFDNQPSGDYSNVLGTQGNGQNGLDNDHDPHSTTHIPDIPEPASFVLMGSGLLAVGLLVRRRRA